MNKLIYIYGKRKTLHRAAQRALSAPSSQDTADFSDYVIAEHTSNVMWRTATKPGHNLNNRTYQWVTLPAA